MPARVAGVAQLGMGGTGHSEDEGLLNGERRSPAFLT